MKFQATLRGIVAPDRCAILLGFSLLAPASSFGQVSVSQISYVKIKDSSTVRQTNATQIISPIAGGESISFAATDADSVTGGGLMGSFDYFSSVVGSGSARFGDLEGKIDTNSSSKPDFVPNLFGTNTTNQGRTSAVGYMALSFEDTGMVTSPTLAVGTPVTLSFTFSLQSMGYLSGRPVDADNYFHAIYMPSATDVSANPVTGVSTSIADLGLQTFSFNTNVGHTLRLDGELDVAVHSQAGRDSDDATYYSQVFGNDDSTHSAHFFVKAPPGVAFVATSGHDYSPLAGDYNGNGFVDAADYVVWRRTLGSTTNLNANGDDTGASAGKIDGADYAVWRANFGQQAGGASGTALSGTSVPEPTTLVLLLSTAVGWRGRRYSAT